MTETSPRPLALSRKVLSIVIGLNLLMGFLIAVLLIASIVAETFTFTALGVSPKGMTGGFLAGMRIIMVVGIAAVLLLFVLARVFDQGARMREDLEGTI